MSQNYSKFKGIARSVDRIDHDEADKREKPSKAVQFTNELAEILDIANFQNPRENTRKHIFLETLVTQ